MGHLRLGELPRTRKWQQVVGLIEGGAGTAQVANATILAAEAGLKDAGNDQGLVETIWLLTQIPLAAKSEDFTRSLRDAGLDIRGAPTLMEVVAAFSDAIDRRLERTGGRTDLGEMAQMAAVESISEVIGERTTTLFETTAADVQRELGRLATNAQFSAFTRQFFGRLTERYLDYFLSRALPLAVGEDRRFVTLSQQADFSTALAVHCKEASRIVETFSGGWFSKTNWEKKGITRQDASGFTQIAMRKIAAELKQGSRPDGE